MKSNLNQVVREYWEKEVCGTSSYVTGEMAKRTHEYFESIEEHRYRLEPFIHSVGQFTRWHGKKILEIGVGAGTDHLQFARAGAVCYGVDLTNAAIKTTKSRFKLYGFKSELHKVDAEKLPFDDGSFDLIYSWGVIHHSEHPDMIIKEIYRVLRPGGLFIGMMYNRRSVFYFKKWIKHALLKGKPWLSYKKVIWHNHENLGTKAYTISELKMFFSEYKNFSTQTFLTESDTQRFPRCLHRFFPDSWGHYVTLRGLK